MSVPAPPRINRARALADLSVCFRGTVPQHIDWEGVISLANETLTTSELHRTLTTAQGGVPADVLTFVSEVHRRSLMRNANLFHTLRDAVAALNRAGIEPVLLKGCALWFAADALDEAPQDSRITGDVDLLVEGPAFFDAAEALVASGFAILTDKRDDPYHRVVVVGREEDAGSIDLHQRAPSSHGVPELEALASAARPVSVATGRARAPGPELQILIAVLHDQLLDGHFWRGGFELRHLLDIKKLCERKPGPDWDMLQSCVRRRQLGSSLTAELLAAREIAGANIPPTFLRDPIGLFHYWRQRTQFVWPWINASFHALGFNRRVWRKLSTRGLSTTRA